MNRQSINILFLCVALLIGTSMTSSQANTHKKVPVHISFGVRIGLLATGKLTQYALVYYRDNKLISTQPISLTRLLKIGSGEWPVPNSATFHNYFKQNNIKNDTLKSGEIVNFQAAFDSLWKIQFPVYPYNHQRGLGWSTGDAKPSLKQQAYIYNRYGVRGYDQQYYADTSFFKLLKDVVNPTWIDHYKALH